MSSRARGGHRGGSRKGSGATSSQDPEEHTVWGALTQESSDSSDERQPLQYMNVNAEWQTGKARRQPTLHGVLLKGETSSSSKSSSAKSKSSAKKSNQTGDRNSSNDSNMGDSVMGDRTEIEGEQASMRDLGEDELFFLLPKDESGNPTSIGSLHHAEGRCSPCVFHQRVRGCKQGLYCAFCHFPHPEHIEIKRNRMRPCKLQRSRFEGFIERLKQQCEINPDEFNPDDVQLPPSITKNPHKAKKIIQDLKDFKAQAQAKKQYLLEGFSECKLSL